MNKDEYLKQASDMFDEFEAELNQKAKALCDALVFENEEDRSDPRLLVSACGAKLMFGAFSNILRSSFEVMEKEDPESAAFLYHLTMLAHLEDNITSDFESKIKTIRSMTKVLGTKMTHLHDGTTSKTEPREESSGFRKLADILKNM